MLTNILKDENIRKCISENLKSNRLKKQLTMLDVGEKIGVCRQIIGMYENNKRFPSVTVLIKLAALYDVTLEELIGYDEIKSYIKR